MSFASEVKKELAAKVYENACCKRSFLYGLLIFSKNFSPSSVGCQTENATVAELYRSLLADVAHVACKMSSSASGKIWSVRVSPVADCQKVRALFSHDRSEISLKINHTNFDCPDCYGAFLAGAFLACGTVSSPRKDYHLEFTVLHLNLAKDFFLFLTEMELSPKETKRRGYPILYFKESESIEDCLYRMGAGNAMFEMMNVEIEKNVRNGVNRKTNCDTANIGRTAKAAAAQINAILLIREKRGLDCLGPELKDLALVRLENPDLSLSELAEVCTPKMSRSGINHRLQKILSIAQELQK